MTPAQINEADRYIGLLNECREHLDNAMYYMGPITDDERSRLREIYELVCKALDKY